MSGEEAGGAGRRDRAGPPRAAKSSMSTSFVYSEIQVPVSWVDKALLNAEVT